MQPHCGSTLKRQRITPAFLPSRTVKIKAENVTLEKKEPGISIIWQERLNQSVAILGRKAGLLKTLKSVD